MLVDDRDLTGTLDDGQQGADALPLLERALVALGVVLVTEAPADVSAGVRVVATGQHGGELCSPPDDIGNSDALRHQKSAFSPHLHGDSIGSGVAEMSHGKVKPMTESPRHDEITEPENSTVDDWIGQRAQRDEERAERIAAETDDPAAAERRYDEVNEDERPGDLPTEQRRR